MNLVEKTIKVESVFKGRILSVDVETVELPNGKIGTREIVRHPGAVAILPIEANGNVILVRQYRKPLNQAIWEIPAGKLSLNEAPENCAYRELEEETGYRASSLFHLGTVAIVPGYCDELLYLYKATNLSLAEKHEDFDEFTEVEIFTLEEVKNMSK